MTIEEVTEVGDDIAAAIASLTVQLSPRRVGPDAEELTEILASPATRLLVARDGDGAIVGMLTLVIYRTPARRCAWIEDLVVDERARGRRIAEELVRGAISMARAQGAESVDLTSRPAREAANRLYPRLGFAPHETNVYRFELR